MNRLLPPNASPLERAVDAGIGLDALPVPLPALWDASNCPAHALPWLAWALRVSDWSSHWNEARQRQAIADSYLVHKHKGTLWALQRVIGHFGGSVILREWWQTAPPGPPYTFELVLNLTDYTGVPASAAEVDAVIAAVHQVKPVRSHFTFSLGVNGQAALRLGGGAIAANYRRLQLHEALLNFTHTLSLIPAARAVISQRLALTET